MITDNHLLGQERDRSKVPEQYTWKLSDIFPSDQDWQAEKNRVKTEIPKVEQYRGKLSQSPAQLLAALDFVTDLSKDLAKVAVYASLHSDENTKVPTYLSMVQEISQIGSDFGAKSAFMQPEILAMDRATIGRFLKEEPKLEIYRHGIEDILRRKDHTGTAGEEKIIADAGIATDNAQDIFGSFSDAEFPAPTMTLSDGKTVTIDKPGFNLYRTSRNREDRKHVFETFFGSQEKFKLTFGAMLYGNVKRDLFYSKARNYESCVASALDAHNIPVAVYHSLVDGVNAGLPTFHRYLNLRKRILGVDTLHYYDLYAPLVSGTDLHYTIDEAQKNVLACVQPLGPEYTATIKKAFTDRWIDYYPTTGKRSGAYSNGGVYDVHPYMLLNYNGKYDDMSTLAHELGHTMHSYFSNKHQPYANSQYPIFVAEVASTFNEALLNDYMLKQIKDDKVRLSLLGSYLEGIKGTVFRQTQFAEFELAIHDRVEKGEALTGDSFDSLYLSITKKYYGNDKGVCIVDDCVKSEWSYIPHFYYNFYVYQYATAFTASAALSEEVMSGDKKAVKSYLEFLSSGSSDYPINLLKKAGVDMTTPKPLELTMQKMNRVMDEIEKILDRMEKK
jgi:oligoendopeptidase F